MTEFKAGDVVTFVGWSKNNIPPLSYTILKQGDVGTVKRVARTTNTDGELVVTFWRHVMKRDEFDMFPSEIRKLEVG